VRDALARERNKQAIAVTFPHRLGAAAHEVSVAPIRRSAEQFRRDLEWLRRGGGR
jgi:hypothetical protein